MNNKDKSGNISGSFRDPSGFLFLKNGLIFRQINLDYKKDYDFFIKSGLYRELVKSGLIIRHKEVGIQYKKSDKAYKIIKPEKIDFVSYPYEWSFSQLKDAALLTLKVQRKALEFGMSLKDCSAYNIQFKKGEPVFIDTLSFEKHKERKPWSAYRQFCQHFLAPLALMSHKDIRLNQLFRIYIDGIPLDLSVSLLPLHSRFSPSLFIHLYLHSKSQKYFSNKKINKKSGEFSKNALLGIIDSLEKAVKKTEWKIKKTEWADYYNFTNYSSKSIKEKGGIVSGFLNKIKPESVWDLGSNNGVFSRIASNKGISTISFDNDPVCVERNYLECKKNKEQNILPLLTDLTNPSPGIGWENNERSSLIERGPTDVVLALALIHHLVISNNIPLNKLAGFFKKICRYLVIEFVPKNDSQAQKLLSMREDIFTDYTINNFEKDFSNFFQIKNKTKIGGSERLIYLMKNRK